MRFCIRAAIGCVALAVVAQSAMAGVPHEVGYVFVAGAACLFLIPLLGFLILAFIAIRQCNKQSRPPENAP